MPLSQKLVIRYVRTKFKLLSSLSKKKAAAKAFELFCTPQHRNKKKLPPVFEKAELLTIQYKGETVRGYRWNKDAGPRLLILHGFESSVVNFDRYIKPFIKKGYEVLGFDAPAHGRSTGKRTNALEYSGLIREVYDQFGPMQAYMAHSFGGLALSLFLETIPHDASTRVAMIAPAMETRTAIDHFFHFLQLDADLRPSFDAHIEKISGHPPAWFSVRRAAQNIRASVLFFQDRDDDMTPFKDVAPLMSDNHPNFEFVITEGLGHRRIYRDNKVSKAIIDFL